MGPLDGVPGNPLTISTNATVPELVDDPFITYPVSATWGRKPGEAAGGDFVVPGVQLLPPSSGGSSGGSTGGAGGATLP